MTLRVGTSFQIERHPRDLAGTVPVEAYLMDHPTDPDGYVWGSGDIDGERTAYLHDDGSGNITIDSDPAAQNRKAYLVDATSVVI